MAQPAAHGQPAVERNAGDDLRPRSPRSTSPPASSDSDEARHAGHGLFAHSCFARIPGAEMSDSKDRNCALDPTTGPAARPAAFGAMGVAAPLAINLAAIGEAAAFEATDYKALVCVFLYGGNDYANTVVPYDPTNYALYHQIRAGDRRRGSGRYRARARGSRGHGAHAPRCGGAHRRTPVRTGAAARRPQALFDAGRLAIQLNVGPLVQPTTLMQYQSSNRAPNPLPPKLFSHNDQQSVWQSNGSEGSTIGWGGRLGDIALSARRLEFAVDLHLGERQCSVRGGSRRACSTRSAGVVRSASPRSTRPLRNRGERHHHTWQRARAGKRMRCRHAALDRARRHRQRSARRRDARDSFSGEQSARETDAGRRPVDRRPRRARRATPGVLRVPRRLRQSQLADRGSSEAHDATQRCHRARFMRPLSSSALRTRSPHSPLRISAAHCPRTPMARIMAGARIIS